MKRYEYSSIDCLDCDANGSMDESPDGEYVRYEDVQAMLQLLKDMFADCDQQSNPTDRYQICDSEIIQRARQLTENSHS